ncbi:AAA family ATPase [Shewanella submarina]|uniref:AAA family ATPase n=1 Tax=Shewanella submarina TaxID=2016376 RepID=A0ABV7GGG0_9GAMM|nr:AAA family ATPase [Shewanella submarina]MCL1038999.1 AAA family ATPase [Shewanella submarina]
MSAAFALLPSQEALLQRLHLNASYTRQLQVVVGTAGAGKTTLITALADELEGYNSALVTCPAHADCAEIRRKILIQLTSSPIFDDEHPLAETLFRLKKDLNQPLHIIIDDAHLLPLTLWAECLVLSQLECGGKPISLTFTATPEFLRELASQMSAEQQGMMLNVQIGSLPITEREVLFQLLLSRSGEYAFLPVSIIAEKLARQSGSPEEVVALLERALSPAEEQSGVRYWLWILIFMLMASAAGVIWWMARPPLEVEEPMETQYFTLSNNSLDALAGRHSDVWSRLVSQKQSPGELLSQEESGPTTGSGNQDAKLPTESADLMADTGNTFKQQGGAKQQAQTAQEVSPSEAKEITSQRELASSKTDPEVTAAVSPVSDTSDEADGAAGNKMPEAGFGVQLVSVKQADSLQDVMENLSNETELIVLKDGDWFLVVIGEFETRSEADAKAKALMTQYGLAAPWVRKWSGMKGYSVYQP